MAGVRVYNPTKNVIRRTDADGKPYVLQPESVGEVPTKEIAEQLVKDFGCNLGGKPKSDEEKAADEAAAKAAKTAGGGGSGGSGGGGNGT